VVEAVSGKPLSTCFAEMIWNPLGMRDTGFLVPAGEVARYARALPNDPLTGQPQSVLDSTQPLRFESGGGGAVSTAADYIRFGQMLLNKGELDGTRILSRKTVELMTADHLDTSARGGPWTVDAGLAGYGFGLGFAVRRAAGIAPVMGSAGDYTWAGAFGTNFWADPKEELAVVHMAHTPGTIRQHYREAFRMLVLQALLD
jgi:CubicO group peptidase (beta-lactamase class C family)